MGNVEMVTWRKPIALCWMSSVCPFRSIFTLLCGLEAGLDRLTPHAGLVSEFSRKGARQKAGGKEVQLGSSLTSCIPVRCTELASSLTDSVISHSGSQESDNGFAGIKSRL